MNTAFPRRTRAALQSGVTLVELLVVMVIISALAYVGSSMTSDGQKMADSLSLYNTADQISQRWRFVTTKCQVPNAIGTSTITTTASATAHLTMLVEGTGVAAAYQPCYNAAKVEPLQRAGVRGSGGTYTFNGSTVTIANLSVNNTNRVATTFTAVDDATVLDLVRQYGNQAGASAMTALAASDATDTGVQYGTATAGARNVTIIR